MTENAPNLPTLQPCAQLINNDPLTQPSIKWRKVRAWANGHPLTCDRCGTPCDMMFGDGERGCERCDLGEVTKQTQEQL